MFQREICNSMDCSSNDGENSYSATWRLELSFTEANHGDATGITCRAFEMSQQQSRLMKTENRNDEEDIGAVQLRKKEMLARKKKFFLKKCLFCGRQQRQKKKTVKHLEKKNCLNCGGKKSFLAVCIESSKNENFKKKSSEEPI